MEGTAGNTGIGLAVISRELGINLKIVIPNTQSIEKNTLKELGANLLRLMLFLMQILKIISKNQKNS